MDSLCHPWFTTTNLSYRFPIFETSATALCGTTGINHILCSLNHQPASHVTIMRHHTLLPKKHLPRHGRTDDITERADSRPLFNPGWQSFVEQNKNHLGTRNQTYKTRKKPTYLNITGWWYTYPSEKYEFVNGKDDIPYMKWKIKKCSKPPTRLLLLVTHPSLIT